MRVTIMPKTGKVGVDGEFRTVDLSTIDPTIHAVQWDGVSGDVEYHTPSRNVPLKDLKAFQKFIDAWGMVGPAPQPRIEPGISRDDVLDLTLMNETVLMALFMELAARFNLPLAGFVDAVRARHRKL